MAQKMNNTASTSGGGSSAGNNRGESVVVDAGRRRSSCGYCRSASNTSISHGLWAYSLTVDDYQALLDRGWRRSGCYLYKPEMERTCCPSYTIRLKTGDFVPSKEQLRVSKRMQRFLDGTLDAKRSDKAINGPSTIKESSLNSPEIENHEENNKPEQYLSGMIDNAVVLCIKNGEIPGDIELPKACVKKVVQAKKKLLIQGFEDLLYSSNISFQIAAASKKASTDENSPAAIAEKLESYMNKIPNTSKLSPKACNGHINFYSTTKRSTPDDVTEILRVCKKKSPAVHISKRQKLEIRLKKSTFDPEEYELYRKYQIRVHNDTPDHVSESSYKRFLVESPLGFVPPNGDATVPPCGFGSFHQQYLLNGQLIAVGVIDILPKCLSSKYLFWDPDLAFLSLGKYSALQEIGWLIENQVHCPSLKYYYLGYYIHSCNKMRYKAAYRPSELLCPLRYEWVPFDIAKPLLDRKKYVILSDEDQLPTLTESLMESNDNDENHIEEDFNDIPVDEDEEMSDADFEDSDEEPAHTSVETQARDVNDIMIGLKGSRLRYKDIQAAIGPNERVYLENQLHRYMKVVGSELSERMVYSLGGF
jgi:arginine-tRNA-protein transferase